MFELHFRSRQDMKSKDPLLHVTKPAVNALNVPSSTLASAQTSELPSTNPLLHQMLSTANRHVHFGLPDEQHTACRRILHAMPFQAVAATLLHAFSAL